MQAGATNIPGAQAEATGENWEIWGHEWGLQRSSKGSGGTGWGCKGVVGAIKALGVQARAVGELQDGRRLAGLHRGTRNLQRSIRG